jgi:hypothetical protein
MNRFVLRSVVHTAFVIALPSACSAGQSHASSSPETLPTVHDIIWSWREAAPRGHGKCRVEMEVFRIVPRAVEEAELNPKLTLHVLTNLMSDSCDPYVTDVIVEPTNLGEGTMWLRAFDSPCTFAVRGDHLRFASVTFAMDFERVTVTHPQTITGRWHGPHAWKEWFGQDEITIEPSGDVHGVFPTDAHVRMAATGPDTLMVTWSSNEQPPMGTSADCRYHATGGLFVLFCPSRWTDFGAAYVTVDHGPRHADARAILHR